MAIPQIKGFPQDNILWRIDWIDDPSNSPDDEPRITVYLSRLVDEYSTDSSNLRPLNKNALFRDINKQYQGRVIYLKIGLLQLLEIGSVWVNGVRQLETTNTLTEKEFSFSLSDIEFIPLTGQGKFGRQTENKTEWEDILTEDQYQSANKNLLKRKWVALIKTHYKYKKIIIPSFVIFQNCYVSSPKVARKIIYGQLDKIVDEKESGYDESDNTIFRICLFKDFKDPEAFLLANLQANPIAKKNLLQLRNNLIIETNSVGPETFGSIRVNFPFDDIKLKAKGKILQYDNGEYQGFFVARLMVVKADYPFETISLLRKNDNRKGETIGDNLQPAFPIGSGSSDLYDDIDDLPITNEDVSNLVNEIEVESFGGLQNNNVKIIKEKKKQQNYQSANAIAIHSDGRGTSISTGAAHSTTTGAHEMAIAQSPVSLDYFFEVVNLLKIKGLNIETIGITEDAKIETNKGIINCFPRYIKGVIKWHLDEECKRTRYFIIARIIYKERYYYLIDVEAKGDSAMSISFISSKTFLEIQDDDLLIFIRRIARENGWPFNKEKYSYLIKWNVKLLRHSRTNTVKKLVKDVIDALEK